MKMMEDANNYTPQEFHKKINGDMDVRLSDAVILMCAILIASIGLNMNSIPVIIGAMLISPLMTPILGVGFSLSLLDQKMFRKSVKLLLLQVGVSVLVATLYFMISPITYPSNEIIARTSPTIWDVIIAFSGGIAGIIGARKKGSNNIVPGAAIATALMPPVCTMGYSIATGNGEYLVGSTYLFIINVGFILIATFIGVRMMGIPLSLVKNYRRNKKVTVALGVISLLILVPSVFSASLLVQESFENNQVSQFISQEFPDQVVLNQKFDSGDQVLSLTISGKNIRQDELADIESTLPDYGLEGVTLEVRQVADLGELTGTEVADFLDQYLQSKISRLQDLEIEAILSN